MVVVVVYFYFVPLDIGLLFLYCVVSFKKIIFTVISSSYVRDILQIKESIVNSTVLYPMEAPRQSTSPGPSQMLMAIFH